MDFQPVANQRHILRADRPPLNDQFSVHWLTTTGNRKLSPEQNEKSFGIGSAPRITGRKGAPNAPWPPRRYVKMRIAAFADSGGQCPAFTAWPCSRFACCSIHSSAL